MRRLLNPLAMIASVGFLMTAAPSHAHHSQSYFPKEFSRIKSKVAHIAWRNLHVRFKLEVTGEDGAARHRQYRSQKQSFGQISREEMAPQAGLEPATS